MLHTQLIQQTGGSDGSQRLQSAGLCSRNAFPVLRRRRLVHHPAGKAARLGYGLDQKSLYDSFPANTDKYPSSSPSDPSPRVSSPLLFLQSPDLHTVSYAFDRNPQTLPSPSSSISFWLLPSMTRTHSPFDLPVRSAGDGHLQSWSAMPSSVSWSVPGRVSAAGQLLSPAAPRSVFSRGCALYTIIGCVSFFSRSSASLCSFIRRKKCFEDKSSLKSPDSVKCRHTRMRPAGLSLLMPASYAIFTSPHPDQKFPVFRHP